jgi:hypothetical protein
MEDFIMFKLNKKLLSLVLALCMAGGFVPVHGMQENGKKYGLLALSAAGLGLWGTAFVMERQQNAEIKRYKEYLDTKTLERMIGLSDVSSRGPRDIAQSLQNYVTQKYGVENFKNENTNKWLNDIMYSDTVQVQANKEDVAQKLRTILVGKYTRETRGLASTYLTLAGIAALNLATINTGLCDGRYERALQYLYHGSFLAASAGFATYNNGNMQNQRWKKALGTGLGIAGAYGMGSFYAGLFRK